MTDPIRVLIVDDEPLARRGIRQLLGPFDDFVVSGEARNGREALRALAVDPPDLVFLDIQMPDLDGESVIRIRGPERMPYTVMVTAHDAYAVAAFEAQALDYLVKPVSERRFRATIERVRTRIRLDGAVALADRLAGLLRGGAAGTSPPQVGGRPLVVPTADGGMLLDPGLIDWIEAAPDGAVVHGGGAARPVPETLTALEARLDPARFIRIHRSTIVALDRIRQWRAEAGERDFAVVLRDGTELAVSRRRASQVRALIVGR
ncbi:MAG: LytR/AlgR family response regulator transcription factor [Gemmatimonadales bacterium]